MYNGQPITKLACGAEFSMIMDCKGNLYSFGCPEYGQLGMVLFFGGGGKSVKFGPIMGLGEWGGEVPCLSSPIWATAALPAAKIVGWGV